SPLDRSGLDSPLDRSGLDSPLDRSGLDSPLDSDALAELVARRYGLDTVRLERVPIGQGAINYRATSSTGPLFVKRYPPQADLAAEARAIGLSETARAGGIPAAAIVPALDGAWIDRSASAAVSVWAWVEGRTVTDRLGPARYAAVGRTLGEIHALFAGLPESRGPAERSWSWRRVSIAALDGALDRLLAIVRQRKAAGSLDAFDAAALVSVPERKRQLGRIPALLAGLPELGSQVLHGDYTFVNLLFRDDAICAVLDFRPPEPFLRSYDLGRIAFHPNTVALDPQWLAIAATVVEAYVAANPTVPAADVAACGRVALVQLAKSLYGIEQHYLEPGLLQDDLDAFWTLRHAAVGVLLDHLDEVEAMLVGLAARR
ncbi:MAG: phosphotransferase, partial [Myxococcota bacterium]